ncbi:MAG: CDP-diacylglycerol--serine O-phosphatidyltransferase [Cytophagales bacterium]|jgi:CDP-diacylglycerol--serine O-phosphatidyltransferase|nr:CDP-diacylglycerol--serine O-phosphatidyltransferase [Bacteroidota bacterium]MBS1982352.1 CDP-diacylglycerol--serine O-phosphatidyltransferase [Bacteroidota bacterium]WHZ07547.1 MAG: CDP-diacylglycerol--serine O-phosphatidyltransferase [Cytophagales bacterium]
MNYLKYLPNTLTCGNLVCGCLGIVFCLENRSVPTAYFVWAAAGFDFFDGFAARWLKVTSPIGKELDSLADVVSFGVLPSLVMYKMLGAASSHPYLPFIAFLIAVCSALRLAIFNVDETQHDSFKGLNTPANTIFITSLVFLSGDVGAFVQQGWMLVLITLVFSALLVSRIDILAFKFKDFSWQKNKLRFTFLICAVLLLVIMKLPAIPLIILLYIAFSLAGKALKLEG